VAGGPPGPAPGWPVDGATVTLVTCYKTDLALASDGSGGALTAWSDNRCNGQLALYVQRTTSAHTPAAGWPANGLRVGPVTGQESVPAIAADGSGGALTAWVDTLASGAELYAAHILANGVVDPQWPVPGVHVASAVRRGAKLALIPDNAGGAIVVWEGTNGGQSDVVAQHLTSSGALAAGWSASGFGLCRAPGDQRSPVAVSDGAGGVLAAWIDSRTLPARIFASRVTGSGTLPPGWSPDGNLVCGTAANAADLAAVGDASGVFLAWDDTRGPATTSDVFAQRVTLAGAIAAGWSANGLTVCAADSAQVSPVMVTDGSGGAFVVWSDRRAAIGGADLYALRVTGSGAVAAGWSANGNLVTDAPGDQVRPAAVDDGAGGFYTVWQDLRDSVANGTDLWLGRAGAAGPLTTQVQAFTASERFGQTFMTWPAPFGPGWTYRVYRSSSPIAARSDLANATLVATMGDSTAYDRRLSVVLGQVMGYAIDSLAAPLDPGSALCVYTPLLTGSRYYAVTAQHGDLAEDRSVATGENSLADPISEVPMPPRPVYQRDIVLGGTRASVFTLWTSRRDFPGFLAMASREGMAFDCAIVRGTPGAPLIVHPHARGGSLCDGVGGTGVPGEWVLAPDDPLPDGQNTFWFGYHPDYDIDRDASAPPTTGTVMDYTYRRLTYTLDWALANFPVDPKRIYAYGYSMGGIGSLELAFWSPARIAAVMAIVGKMDFSFLSDPDTSNWFNPAHAGRGIVDRMWGTVATNLPTTAHRSTYTQLNLGALAQSWAGTSLPPVFAFNGKRDNVTGWAEKIGFYQAMRSSHLGGCFFWSPEDHMGTQGRLWTPMMAPAYLYRFRSDLSYPALANCSLDSNPGDGAFASGDSVGTINAFLEWDPAIADQPDQWRVVLRLRNLSTTGGTLVPPESCTVDVSPARLQKFIPGNCGDVTYSVTRLADNTVVQAGNAIVGPSGAIIVSGVKVYRTGSAVTLTNSPRLEVGPGQRPRPLALALGANPVRSSAELIVQWPSSGGGVIEVVDIAGRIRARLEQASGSEAAVHIPLDLRRLRAGLYFVRASAAGSRLTRRMIVLD